MKKLCFLTAFIALSFTAVHAKNTQQTKPVKKSNSHAKKVNANAPTGGKIVYVNFDIKDKDMAAMASKKKLVAELMTQMQQRKLMAWLPEQNSDNVFFKPITYRTLMNDRRDVVLVDLINKDGEKTGTKKMFNEFTVDRISGYRIKQEVVIDKVTGATQTTIVGIALGVPLLLSNGDTISVNQPICWLKYTQCKNLLVSSTTVSNKKFDVATWNALFTGGMVKQ